MLLPPGTRRRTRTRLRDTLRTACTTYRRHSPLARSAKRPHDAVVAVQDPDVLLDIPTLKIEEIDLELDELSARVALEAQVLDMLRLHVGADATLGRVKLQIKGVEAQAQLKVRLDNLAGMVEQVMDTVDHHPELISRLTNPPALVDAVRSAVPPARSSKPLAGGSD